MLVPRHEPVTVEREPRFRATSREQGPSGGGNTTTMAWSHRPGALVRTLTRKRDRCMLVIGRAAPSTTRVMDGVLAPPPAENTPSG